MALKNETTFQTKCSVPLLSSPVITTLHSICSEEVRERPFKFHDWFNQVIPGEGKSLKQIVYRLISPITWYDGTKAVTNLYVHIYIIYSQLSS